MDAKIIIMLRESIRDNQGSAVANVLRTMGYDTVKNVRIGKYIEITVPDENTLNRACEEYLVNGVMENYTYELGERGNNE